MRTAERTRVSALKGGHARCQTQKYNNILPNGTLKKSDGGAIKTSKIKYLNNILENKYCVFIYLYIYIYIYVYGTLHKNIIQTECIDVPNEA